MVTPRWISARSEGDAGRQAGGEGGKEENSSGAAVKQGWYVREKLSSEVSSWVARSNLIQLS